MISRIPEAENLQPMNQATAHDAINYAIALEKIVGRQNIGRYIDPTSLTPGPKYNNPPTWLQQLLGQEGNEMQQILGKTYGGRDVRMGRTPHLGYNPTDNAILDLLNVILYNPAFSDTLKTSQPKLPQRQGRLLNRAVPTFR
jgi:hypothetical protein